MFVQGLSLLFCDVFVFLHYICPLLSLLLLVCLPSLNIAEAQRKCLLGELEDGSQADIVLENLLFVKMVN